MRDYFLFMKGHDSVQGGYFYGWIKVFLKPITMLCIKVCQMSNMEPCIFDNINNNILVLITWYLSRTILYTAITVYVSLFILNVLCFGILFQILKMFCLIIKEMPILKAPITHVGHKWFLIALCVQCYSMTDSLSYHRCIQFIL